jgi:hypothetical protein
MCVTTLPPSPRESSVPISGDATVARLLTGWAVTLLPLLAAVVALELGWSVLATVSWPVTAGGVAGWALASAGWLSHRRWPAGHVLTVIAGPALALALPGALGELSPAGLQLWGPVSTVLAVALAMTIQPRLTSRPHPACD